MRVASLGSGSKGNGTVVASGDTCLLVDCGFSLRETTRCLARLGLAPGDIDAILVTHEHSDHAAGVGTLSRGHGIPVHATHGTAASGRLGECAALERFNAGEAFTVGSVTVRSVAVPHDAREPCQYRLAAGGRELGILTDLGSITPHVVAAYRGCQGLVLEFNHDPQMLADGPYPYAVKKRVGGDFGHLTNAQARQFLDHADTTRLKMLFVAHISQQNNAPELADAALSSWSGLGSCQVIHATQETGFDWCDLRTSATFIEEAAQA